MRAIHGHHIDGLAAPDRLDRGGVNHPEVAIPPRGVQRERRHVDVKRHACLGVLEQPERWFPGTGEASAVESRTRSSSLPSSAGRYARDGGRRRFVRESDMRRSFLIVGTSACPSSPGRHERARLADSRRPAPVSPGSSAWDLERLRRQIPNCWNYRRGEELPHAETRPRRPLARFAVGRTRIDERSAVVTIVPAAASAKWVGSEIGPGVEGITTTDVAGDQTLAEPLDPLGRSAVGEGVWNHVALGLLLQGVIANGRRRVEAPIRCRLPRECAFSSRHDGPRRRRNSRPGARASRRACSHRPC